MDLNQKTLVSLEYVQTYKFTDWYKSVYCNTGYWKKTVQGNTGGRKLILLFIVQSMHLMCNSNSKLSFVVCASAHHCKYLISIWQLNKHST